MGILKRYLALASAAAVAVVALPFIVQAQRSIKLVQAYVQIQPSEKIAVLMQDGKIETLEVEDYLVGVVAAEMPPSFEEEALKAQAVAARTYAILRRDSGNGRKEHGGADVCTDPAHCKGYTDPETAKLDWGENGEKNLEKIRRAVESTAGEVIVYQEEMIDAVFHAASSGYTESAADVWGGERPYLVSVYSKGDMATDAYDSSVDIKASAFKSMIQAAFPSADLSAEPEKWCGEITHTTGGAVKEILVGGVPVAGTRMRELFTLRSAAFTVAYQDGTFAFAVKGYGHGVGMSQNGANYLAKEGKDYIKILKQYYTGVDVVPYGTLK